jgi:dihydroneopterin aldolase
MNASWTVRVDRMEVSLPVGIYADEVAPQPLWVSITATGMASATPGVLGDCFDYEPLYHWLTQVWPATPHTPLLETRMNELMAFVFDLDLRLDEVWVGLYKQRLSRHAMAVGMERRASRAEFTTQRAHALSTRQAADHLIEELKQHADQPH